MKLYIKIQYQTDRHQIIRCDSIPEFKRFVTDENMKLHFDWTILKVKSGEKIKAEPYIFQVEDSEFKQLYMAIKRKISSSHKKEIKFKSISLTEDSYHLPMIKIVPVEREVHES